MAGLESTILHFRLHLDRDQSRIGGLQVDLRAQAGANIGDSRPKWHCNVEIEIRGTKGCLERKREAGEALGAGVGILQKSVRAESRIAFEAS